MNDSTPKSTASAEKSASSPSRLPKKHPDHPGHKRNMILLVSGVVLLLIAVIAIAVYSFRKYEPEEQVVEEIPATEGFFAQIEEEQTGPVSPISGVACENYDRRPFGVMMASDSATRSYSAGFWDADLVVEQKASSGAGIPRLMSVFICGSPKEIGSIRSAREQYIPFAQALDAVIVHWGGEHNILDQLNAGIMDNINALGRGAGAFYRISSIPRPHNGFTSTTNVLDTMESLGYRMKSELKPFAHAKALPVTERGSEGKLTIPYGGNNTVNYAYDAEKNHFARTWGAAAHIDVNTDEQIAPTNIVVIRAASRDWYSQYNQVDIEDNGGEAEFYINGKRTVGTWKHSSESGSSPAQLEFLDASGQPVEFVPGQIWLNVVDPGDPVEWTGQ